MKITTWISLILLAAVMQFIVQQAQIRYSVGPIDENFVHLVLLPFTAGVVFSGIYNLVQEFGGDK